MSTRTPAPEAASPGPESPRPGQDARSQAELEGEPWGPRSAEVSSGAAPWDFTSAAEPQRGLFDLRRALQSAVRVLTKERSFLPDGSGSGAAAHEAAHAQASERAPHREREAASSDDSPAEWTDPFPASESEPAAVPPPIRPIGLSGHTSTVAVPEVLGFLAQLRKTGTLWIWNEREHYRMQLIDGNVTFARNETPHQGSLLGEILVAHGAIDADALDEFLRVPREPGPLGDALVSAGLVDRRALTEAIQFQAQRVFNRAYGLEDAHFTFDGDDQRVTQSGIRISVTQMLFESARERDESEQRLSKLFDDPFAR